MELIPNSSEQNRIIIGLCVRVKTFLLNKLKIQRERQNDTIKSRSAHRTDSTKRKRKKTTILVKHKREFPFKWDNTINV